MQDELEAARERQDDLREQIDRLRGMLESLAPGRRLSGRPFPRRHLLRTSHRRFRATWRPSRQRRPDCDHGPTQYTFPAIDQRDGADPTWAATLDALRKPRDRSERLWEWRRSAPIRPVVFEDPGTSRMRSCIFTWSTRSSAGSWLDLSPRASSITICRAPA